MFTKEQQTRKNIYTVEEFKATFSDEESLQKSCEEYLKLMKIDYIRIPSSVYSILFGSQSKLTAGHKAFIAGYLKGIKDLIVLKRFNDKYALAFIVELKTKKGKLSQGQKNKHQNLPTAIIRNFDDFKVAIDNFMEKR